jgi:hypothetical protein
MKLPTVIELNVTINRRFKMHLAPWDDIAKPTNNSNARKTTS